MKQPRDVDEYIKNSPKDRQERLRRLREVIKAIAPKAEERISYAMPYYDYKGKLVYFGLFKDHISMFIPGSVVSQYKSELKEYETTGATIRFPHNKELPIPLIKKLIQARVAMNDIS